ncbi:hypothetical protein EJ08DRAFT_613947, partial [Tothia fuscella]
MSYQPPSGPPPIYGSSSGYASPPGPPPNHDKAPSIDNAPPPYHDWTVIPDTSTLPPPPALSHDFSTGANATGDEAERGRTWCFLFPLWSPRPMSSEQLQAARAQNHTLIKAETYVGDLLQHNPGPGIWKCWTFAGCKDSLIQTALPNYSAPADSPMVTGRSKMIYFEIKIHSVGRQGPPPSPPETADAGVAIGFFAPPYPSFRLPGWQRGSLGVHSDDGRRYVNNTDGGLDFTQPFLAGQTVGLGMTFSIPRNPPAYDVQENLLDVEVFFTRDGRKQGSWDLHEEMDQDQEGVQGLEGNYDLFPAVGVWGGCDFEIRFQEKDWMYRP